MFGAFAVSAFALLSPDAWRIAESLEPVRLGLLAAAAIIGTVVSLIAGHRLWERGGSPESRPQVVLFNLATTLTVACGVLVLYIAQFVVLLAAALVLLKPNVLAQAVGHGAGMSDYLKLVWLAASLATTGGALGAALESNDAVREASRTPTGQREAPRARLREALAPLLSSLRRAGRSRAAPPARGVTAHCTGSNETRGAAAPDPARYDGQVPEGMLGHLLEVIPVPGLGREPGHERHWDDRGWPVPSGSDTDEGSNVVCDPVPCVADPCLDAGLRPMPRAPHQFRDADRAAAPGPPTGVPHAPVAQRSAPRPHTGGGRGAGRCG